jgi:hypothetical protein
MMFLAGLVICQFGKTSLLTILRRRHINMKLSGYIQDLKELLEEEGDLSIVYGSDDEGYDYHPVIHTPCIGMYNNFQGGFLTLKEYDELKRKDELWYPDDSEKVVCIN